MPPESQEKQEFPDHWLQGYVEAVLARRRAASASAHVTLSTGKTPSGHIHLGILREIIICDALRRKLEELDEEVHFNLFFDNLDAAKRFPPYIPGDYAKIHLGKPFQLMPAPFDDDPAASSYAEYFGNELTTSLEKFGVRLTPRWTHALYQTPDMQDHVRTALQQTPKIKAIIKKYLFPTLDEAKQAQFEEMQRTWMPAMVICEQCERTQHRQRGGTIQPNRVLAYQPEADTVTYECPACGHAGTVGISSGRVKLNWRVDWPAKWDIFQTTLEPAGKDHAVKGGSYDTGLDLCQEVFGYEGPLKLPYEWLRLGDKDMGTSKGVVFTPKRYLTLGRPELVRLLILRTNPNKHISFRLEELAQLYDEYERIERIYYGLEEAESEETEREYKYLYPLCQVSEGPLPEAIPKRLPFRFLMVIGQLVPLLGADKVYEKCVEMMRKLDFQKILPRPQVEEDLDRVRQWLAAMRQLLADTKDPGKRKKLARNVTFIDVPDEVTPALRQKLSDEQRAGLKVVVEKYRDDSWDDETRLQNTIFSVAKDELEMKPRALFQAVYLSLLGEKMGPRLGPLLLMLEKDWVLERFRAMLA